MKKLGVEIDEEFEIEGLYSLYSPHHFDKQGRLIDRFGFDYCTLETCGLIYDEVKIKKISKPEPKEMTMEQLQEALRYPVKIVKGDE